MKRFFCIILTFIISILICLLCLSYGIKDTCINTISNVIVKREITSKIILSVKEVYPDASFEALGNIENAIGNNASINELTTKFFDEIINSIVKEEDVKVPDTKEELLSLIRDNEAILKSYGVEVSEEQKNKVINDIVESNVVNEVYEKVTTIVKKNLSDNQKTAVHLYQIVTSNNFRILIIFLIIFMIILLMLIKKSFYRFSINLGIAGILSGTFVTFILPLVVNSVENVLTDKLIGEGAQISINKIINYGYVCFVFGALFIILYLIGNKIVNYNKSKYAK